MFENRRCGTCARWQNWRCELCAHTTFPPYDGTRCPRYIPYIGVSRETRDGMMEEKDLLKWTQSMCNSHGVPFTPSGVRQLLNAAGSLRSALSVNQRQSRLRQAVDLLSKPQPTR